MSFFRGGYSCAGRLRTAGKIMAAIGAVLLLWLVPAKLWGAVLGLALLAAGLVLWRIG